LEKNLGGQACSQFLAWKKTWAVRHGLHFFI